MIEEPGSFSGRRDFRDPRARPRSHEADIVSDLEQTRGQRIQRAGQFHFRVVHGERLELVRRRDEGQARFARHLIGEPLRKSGGGIEPGSDRGSALRKHVHARHRAFHTLHAIAHGRRVTGKFLAERHGGCILHVGSADLDDPLELDRLLLDGARKMLQRGEEGALDLDGGRDVHRRRERIVRGLRAVYMVVGVYGLLRALCPAEHFDGAILR